jgi:AraC-like DNA-binding protein
LSDLRLRIDNIIENRRRLLQDYPKPSEGGQEKPLTPEEEFLKKATECLEAHMSDPTYDRETFASDMGASPSTLYNKLRTITGMNVSSFIRDVRMKEARRLAEQDPSQRISDLAYKVGFQDPKYFSTCFKKHFGMQPKEFMDSLQTKNS